MKRFLQSLPVTISTSVANTSVQSQVSVAPVLTTTSTPIRPRHNYSLRASAPSFSSGAATQSVFTVCHFEHGLGLSSQIKAPSSPAVTPQELFLL